ncbi:unnamed protein product [Closterium sp. NIES-64]|nr:unnamed protein product [Closterium sp. NIES-64]
MGEDAERPRWYELLKAGVDIFFLDYDAVITAMYALEISADGDCYLCVMPDPGIETGTLGAGEAAALDSSLAPLLGHPSLPRLRGMHRRLLVYGLPRSLPPLPASPAPPCLPCIEGRQHAAPHSSSFPPTEAPLQTLHLDVWGPARVRGQGGERYFLLVVDDYSRYTTVFPLCTKGEVPAVLIPWIRAVRLQLRRRFRQDLRVLRVHSDRGGEFTSDLLRAFCQREGIEQFFMLPGSPQQNGVAEHRIGLVMEQLNLWPCVSLPETSPTLRWTGEVGDASCFRVRGARALVRDTSADKLYSRTIPCVYLGFVPDAPRWQFYHPISRRVLPSQDVTFNESVPFYRLFPYRTAPLPPPPLFLAPDPPPLAETVEVTSSSGAAAGGAARGAAFGGAEPAREVLGSAEPGGAEPAAAEPGGAEPTSAEPGGAEPEGAGSGGAESAGIPLVEALGVLVSLVVEVLILEALELLGLVLLLELEVLALRVLLLEALELVLSTLVLETLELEVPVLGVLLLETLGLEVLVLGVLLLVALELEVLELLEALELEVLQLESLELEVLLLEALELEVLELLEALELEVPLLEAQELEVLELVEALELEVLLLEALELEVVLLEAQELEDLELLEAMELLVLAALHRRDCFSLRCHCRLCHRLTPCFARFLASRFLLASR